MGMKKSVVDTTPRSASKAYTAASSREVLPTQSVCLTVPVIPPRAYEGVENIRREHRLHEESRKPSADSTEPANPEAA